MDSVKDKRWPQSPKAASYPGATEGVHVQGLVIMIASLMATLVPRTRLRPALTAQPAICPAADIILGRLGPPEVTAPALAQ